MKNGWRLYFVNEIDANTLDGLPLRRHMEWDVSAIEGPQGDDWRVPAGELAQRMTQAATALSEAGIESMLVHDPVDLYWLTGGRQNGTLLVGSSESNVDSVYWVRASLDRARWEAGGDAAPFELASHPSTKSLDDELKQRGCTTTPAMQHGKMPHNQATFYHDIIGESSDCTRLLYSLRESKSLWEIEQMRASGEVNRWMFEAIYDEGGEGVSEIELAAAADSVSRAAGFGGHIMMRKWPMNCDRVVIAAGHSGAVPSYFDSAIGGTGPHPFASLGAGFHRIKIGEPVLVDIVHCHRGYVSDCTRMFSVGPLNDEWTQRLESMVEISSSVVTSLAKGDTCEMAYEGGMKIARELGYDKHLMGMPPDQARFLGHSIGLHLDETPVVARGFPQPLPIGGTMAIEPKVIYPDGAIGVEDSWVRTENGMECLTAGDLIPLHQEW